MGQRRGRSFELLIAMGALPLRVVASALRRLAPGRADGVLQSIAMASAGLSSRDFEKLVGTGFQQRGFILVKRVEVIGEGAVRLVLTRNCDRFLVECKHRRAPQVKSRAVRDLHEVMAEQGMVGGFLVTSGTFTTSARRSAAAKNIELIDGLHLDALLRDGRLRIAEVIFSGIAANGPETAPNCPACKTPMIVRTAKRGTTTGSFFWACSQYPTCRQTMVMWSEGRRSA